MVYKLKRDGHEWPCVIIKSANLSTGYSLYLLKRETESPFTGAYVVGSRKQDTTIDFKIFDKSATAIAYYLNLLACYA